MHRTVRKIVVGGRTWTYVVTGHQDIWLTCRELNIKYTETSFFIEKPWKGGSPVRPRNVRASIEEYCKKNGILPVVAKKEPERV